MLKIMHAQQNVCLSEMNFSMPNEQGHVLACNNDRGLHKDLTFNARFVSMHLTPQA